MLNNQENLITLLNEVADVLNKNNLRSDLQEALRYASATAKVEAKMTQEQRFKNEEYAKFEAWHTQNIPHDPITGSSAALRWSGWFTRSQLPTNVIDPAKITQLEQILDASRCERFDAYGGEGGGVYKDENGDYIYMDDVQKVMNEAVAALKDQTQ